jgi:site-specific recombinase XerD
MVEALRTALTHHRTMAIYRTPEDYVFASASGRPMNPDQLRKTLQAALRSLGITFEHPRADGLHLLRHSSGSVVHNTLGGDLKTTQEWLGHSNSRITSDVYVHLEDGQQRRAAEAAERAIFQPTVGITKGQA